jgi:hypothetical protein
MSVLKRIINEVLFVYGLLGEEKIPPAFHIIAFIRKGDDR